MTNDQLLAMIEALQEILVSIHEKITNMQKLLEERKREEQEWDEFLSHPGSQTFLKNLTEETKADMAAGRTKEWKTCRENLLHT